MGLRNCLPISVLDPKNGFILETPRGQGTLVIAVAVEQTKAPPPAKRSPTDYFNAAEELYKLMDYKKAVSEITEAINMVAGRGSDWFQFLNRRAQYYKEDKRFDSAQGDIAVVLKFGTSDPNAIADALLCKSEILLRTSKFDEALATVDEVLATSPKNFEATALRTSIMARLRDVAEANLLKSRQKAAAATKTPVGPVVAKASPTEPKPAPAKAARVEQCAKGRSCVDPDCPLSHPPGRQLPVRSPISEVTGTLSKENRANEVRADPHKKTIAALERWFEFLSKKLNGFEPKWNELSEALFSRKAKAQKGPSGSNTSSIYPRASSGQMRGLLGALGNKAILGSLSKAGSAHGAGKAASIRVLATLYAFREIESIEGLQPKILNMFAGRGLHQAQKKVFDKVFEGRLNKKERIFFAELERDTYVITSVVLNHKVSLAMLADVVELLNLSLP